MIPPPARATPPRGTRLLPRRFLLASFPRLPSLVRPNAVLPEPPSTLLSDSQRRVVGAALTLLAFLGSLALLIVAVYVLGRLVAFFSGVLWPLAVAGVLALMLRPVVERLEGGLRLRRLAAVALLYFVVVLLAAGGLLLFVPPIVEQLINFVAYLPDVWRNAVAFLEEHHPDWIDLVNQQLANPDIRSSVDTLIGEGKALFSHAVPSLRAAFGGILDVGAFIAQLAIIPVYLFFFLLMRSASTKDLGTHVPFLRPGVRDDFLFLVDEFVAIVEAFFRGQILIGLCMGVLYAIGFSLGGLKFGLFIGLALGLLNIIPYLGTIMGLAVALPLAFFQPDGGWYLVGIVLVVNAVVQSIEAWLLTPKIMGHQTGLHPVMIIFAVFFWGTAFGGILGMLLAVPLTAFFVTAWRLAKRKYFRRSSV